MRRRGPLLGAGRGDSRLVDGDDGGPLLGADRGGSLLARDAADDPGTITGRRVAAAARAGDRLALRAVSDLGRWLGEGLALVADVFDPEVVTIGGGVARSAPLFLDAAREHDARALTGAGCRPLARIRLARLGEAAAVIGAAQLARDLVAD